VSASYDETNLLHFSAVCGRCLFGSVTCAHAQGVLRRVVEKVLLSAFFLKKKTKKIKGKIIKNTK